MILKKVVAVKQFAGVETVRPEADPTTHKAQTARDVRNTILHQLMFLLSTGDLDESALKRVGLNLHIYRTTGKGLRVVDVRSTDGVATEGDADRITCYLRKSLRRTDMDASFYFTEHIMERLDDFNAFKKRAIEDLGKYSEIDYVGELLSILSKAEDMVAAGEKDELIKQGIISLDYMSDVINRLQRTIRRTQGRRDQNITQIKRKIQKLRGKMISGNIAHYMNYPYFGDRGFKEKIDMFGRRNIGYYLRVAVRIPRSDEIMVISVNPWRGACNAFREGEREETINLFKTLVTFIAREWKFSRLKLENIPVKSIEKFNEDDILGIVLGLLQKDLSKMNLDSTDVEVADKIQRIQGWGPVWNLDEIMIVIAMLYREAPVPTDLVKLLKSEKFKGTGIKVYGDDDDGYFIYLKGIGETKRDAGIINAGHRREHLALGDYYSLIVKGKN